jgi:hypothetical protein
MLPLLGPKPLRHENAVERFEPPARARDAALAGAAVVKVVLSSSFSFSRFENFSSSSRREVSDAEDRSPDVLAKVLEGLYGSLHDPPDIIATDLLWMLSLNSLL